MESPGAEPEAAAASTRLKVQVYAGAEALARDIRSTRRRRAAGYAALSGLGRGGAVGWSQGVALGFVLLPRWGAPSPRVRGASRVAPRSSPWAVLYGSSAVRGISCLHVIEMSMFELEEPRRKLHRATSLYPPAAGQRREAGGVDGVVRQRDRLNKRKRPVHTESTEPFAPAVRTTSEHRGHGRRHGYLCALRAESLWPL